MNEHPLVEDLFVANPSGYARIASGDGHAFARRQAERLLQRCALRSGIVGLEKLATDGGASTGKFASMLAEVTFALTFNSLGARVQLLRDEAFLPASYTPDLFVTFRDGFEVLVDVVRIAGGSAPLADALRSALKAKQLPYAVEQCAGLKLSIPAFDWSTHNAAKELCSAVADSVSDALQNVPRGASGVVRTFESGHELISTVELGADARENLYDDATGEPGPEWLGSFGFAPSLDNRASAGGGVTSGHIIDDETHGRKFVERVRSKAARRRGLPSKHAHTPFIVALQSYEPELRPLTVLSNLTGPRHWSPPAKPAPLVPRFEDARSRGWELLLKEWGYVGVSEMRFPNYGVFGDEAARWAKDVSGVMVLHDSDTLLQWLPNPFAADAIADPRLLDIGFPFEMLGASSPDEGE